MRAGLSGVLSARWGRLPWWLPVALLALGLRLIYVLAEQPPLHFSTSQHYFTGALEIVQHDAPFDYVLRDDGWHLFNDVWTVAPLYPLFVAVVFALFGTHLLSVQIVQAVLEAATAVGFGAFGRRLSPRFGAWAGVAYAIWWPSIDFSAQTMTEGLHNALMAAAFLALSAADRGDRGPAGLTSAPPDGWPRWRRAALAGALLGLAALARPVSLTFVPLAGVLLAWRGERRRALGTFAAVALGGTLVVAPWTLRNIVFRGDLVVIESISAYTLWYDNASGKPARFGQQDRAILEQPTPAARRAKALELAWLNIRSSWRELPEKVADGLNHLLRPQGLFEVVRLADPAPAWRPVARVLGDDLLVLASLALLPAALAAARARGPLLLAALWLGYVGFMLVVVFHTEVRYRMGLAPPLFATGTAGLEALLDSEPGRRRRARLAAGAGALLALALAWPYARPLWQLGRAELRLRPLAAAVGRGDLVAADVIVATAAQAAPEAAQPWLRYGGLLARAGHHEEARRAYEEAERRQPACWLPAAVLPQLLRQAGRNEEALARAAQVARDFRRPRAWEPLEAAWRELPAPRRDEVVVGRDDYGALRRFSERRVDTRWSQPGAALRLMPTQPAAAYRATLVMASPEPSPNAAPEVRVRCSGSAPVALRLTRVPAAYAFDCAPAPGQALEVWLEAPAWNRPGRPVDAGVQVARLSVVPLP